MKSPRALHILPELAPYTGNSPRARAGALLCSGLAEFGVDVTVVAPAPRDPERYGFARRLRPLAIPGDSGIIPVTIYEGVMAQGRVRTLLVQSEDIGVVCRAALCAAAKEKRWPHVVHATHGTELAPLLVKAGWLNQGAVPTTVFNLLGLHVPSRRDGGIDRRAPFVRDAIAAATNNGVRSLAARDRALSIAIECSDAIVAESPRYVHELLAADAADHHALSLARVSERIRTIAAGVDTVEWKFHLDRHVLGHPRESLAQRKARTKLDLQRELGLAPQRKRPMIGVVGPYEHLDEDTVVALERTRCQLAFLLDSQRDVNVLPMLRKLAKHRVAARFADTSTLHRLTAAADFMLLPHNFEAKGTSQLNCCHYGTVPIAAKSGAFADTIIEIDSNSATGNGIVYDLAEPDALSSAVKRAIRAFGAPQSFARIRSQMVKTDLSWRSAARRHAELYMKGPRVRADRTEKLATRLR